MANILPFPNWAGRRTPDFGDPVSGGPKTIDRSRAEVVIFPGIRIEREDFSLADRLPGRKLSHFDKETGKPRHDRDIL